MRAMVKKVVGCVVAAAAIAAVAPCAFAEMKDIDGNAVSNTTSFAAVDGETGTVGDFLGIGGFATKEDLAKATPGDYANVSNKAYAAATQTALTDEVTRAKSAEQANATAISDEVTARQTADEANADAIAAETTRAKSAEAAATAYTTAVSNKLEKTVATKADASALSAYAKSADLATHTNDTNNPHKVTAAQVGVTLSDGTLTVGDQSITPLTSYAETDPTFAAWTNGTSIAAGQGASVNGEESVVLGCDAAMGDGYYGTVIGNSASAYGPEPVALGSSAVASNYYAIAIGPYAKAFGIASSAIGFDPRADSQCSVAIGKEATANNESSIAIGENAMASSKKSVAIGYDAYAKPEWNSAVAFSATPNLVYFNSQRYGENTARTLQSYLDERATTNAVNALAAALADKADAASISAANAAFSNAVLAVTTSFDTNTVAQINALIEDGAVSPLAASTGVGAALAAIAAALAALKKSLDATDAKVSAANTTLEEVA